jgi:type IV pilus assembly protein PilM
LAFELPFSPKSPPLVGLDIGSSSVKLVELSDAGGTMRLERYAIEPLPRGAVVDGNIDKIDVVAEAVKRAWRRAGIRIKNVAMALPASAVITKRIALPANLREEELEIHVDSDANHDIPDPLDEESLDFQVLGAIPNAPDDVEVLIAASRKEKVEDRMAVAQAAGLKPAVVDVESYAMRAALERVIEQLPNRGEGLVIAVFYIGANTTSVTVMHDGEAIYEREQPFGGQQLTGQIERA